MQSVECWSLLGYLWLTVWLQIFVQVGNYVCSATGYKYGSAYVSVLLAVDRDYTIQFTFSLLWNLYS